MSRIWSVEDEPISRDHTLHLGTTGYGKSTLIAQRFHKITKAGYGCAVFSPSPDLIDDMLARMDDKELERTWVVDPMNPNHSVGINLLQVVKPGITDEDAAAFTATFLLDVIRDTFGKEALQVRGGGILKEFLGLMLLGNKQLPECYVAWDPTDAGVGYRRALYDKARAINPFYEAYISAYIDAIPVRNRQEMLEASINKMKPLFDFPALTVTLLQPEPTLNLSQVIQKNQILLVDLSSVYLGNDGVRVLGGFLLAAIYQSAIELHFNSTNHNRYWPVFCDEFADYANDRILLGLAQARKIGLFFELACQDMDVVERILPKAWGTIMANCTKKHVFKLTDEQTANSVVSSLWGYNARIKDSVGPWNSQKEVHAANLGALGSGEYYYQNGKLTETSAKIDGEAVRYLKARLETTSGKESGGVVLPGLRDSRRSIQEQAATLRDQLAALRTNQRPRSHLYEEIRRIYHDAADAWSIDDKQSTSKASNGSGQNGISSNGNSSSKGPTTPLPGTQP